MIHPVEFTEGIRVLMIIDRGVGNTHKGSHRWVNKLVSTNTKEFYDNLAKLQAQLTYMNNPNARIYGCINSRHLDKSIRLFNHRQIDVRAHDEHLGFYKDIRNSFVSCLMSPENSSREYYLVDIDRPHVPTNIVDAILKEFIVHTYKTPNGWHVICKPFDVRLVEDFPDTEVKKDGLMIWGTL
jgi:hypothetical protein